LLLKDINTFIEQVCIKLIKSDTFFFIVLNNAYFKNPENIYHYFNFQSLLKFKFCLYFLSNKCILDKHTFNNPKFLYFQNK